MIAIRRRVAAFLLGPLLLIVAACDSAEDRVRMHHERGLSFAQEGRPELAVIEFASALRIDEAHLPSHRAIARAYRAEGRPERAAPHFRRVAEALPDDVDARIDLARVLLELDDPEGAARHAAVALRLAPEDPRAMALQGAVDFLRGDIPAALAAARAALEADPTEALARLVLVSERVRAGDPHGALAHLDAARTGDPGGFAFALIRIRLLERLGDRAAVGAALERLSGFYPENESIRLAIVRWRMQGSPPDLEGAEAELRAIAARHPDDPDRALRVVGFLAQTRGPQAARAELEALAAAPDAPAAFERALAVSEARAGALPAAIARMEAAIGGPDPVEADRARLLLARLLDRPGRGGGRSAALIDAVLDHDPGNVEARVLRAALRMRADDNDGAVADLRAALEEAPDSAPIHEMLAEAHARNGASELAIERLALAVRASGHAPGPSRRLADRLLEEGKAAAAESVLRDALRGAPRDRGLLIALARLRLERADWTGAQRAVAALEEVGGAPSVAARIEAAALGGQGRMDETLAVLRDSWEARRDGDDLAALVRAHAWAGVPDRAEALLRARLDETPDDIRALALLAGLRETAGDPAAAEALLRRAVAAAPTDPGAHDALVAFRLRRGDARGAAQALRAGLALLPGDPTLRFRDAIRREAEGDAEGAIAIYEDLHAADPGNALIANNLASLLAEHRDDPESLARAAAVARRLRGSPFPAFQDTYGWTLLRSGDAAGAIGALRAAAAAMPGNATVRSHLAAAWRALDRPAEARAEFAAALSAADAAADADAAFPRRAEAEAALAALDAALDAGRAGGTLAAAAADGPAPTGARP